MRPRARDAARWHAYATRDDYVGAADLPYVFGDRVPADVVAAVSSVTRCPVDGLRRRGDARTLLVAALRWLTPLSPREIGDLTGLSARAVRDVRPREVPGLTIVERVAGDPRFLAVDGALPDLGAYRLRQIRNAQGPGWSWQ